jgi:hypothetical protein
MDTVRVSFYLISNEIEEVVFLNPLPAIHPHKVRGRYAGYRSGIDFFRDSPQKKLLFCGNFLLPASNDIIYIQI